MLDKTAEIQYFLNMNSITNFNLYPLIDDEIFIQMRRDAMANPEYLIIYPFVRSVNKLEFVDIYVFDHAIENGNRRFIIARNEVMPLSDELAFIEYAQSQFVMNPVIEENFKNQVKKLWNINLYDSMNNRCMLLRLYFSAHKAGVLELLFKMKLDNIAIALDEFEDINFVGTNVKEIFGMPAKMLLKCNTKERVEFIQKEENRILANEIYKTFHNEINRKNVVNKYQVRYLYECHMGNLTFCKGLFREIAKIQDDTTWVTLQLYLSHKSNISVDFYSFLPACPKMDQIERLKDICLVIEGYELQEEACKRDMQTRFFHNKIVYGYEDEDWYVTGPDTVFDILEESKRQRNCLFSYIPQLLYSNKVTILFARQKHSNSLGITIEISDGCRIVQALRSFNQPVSEFEKQFLNRYANEKLLSCEF